MFASRLRLRRERRTVAAMIAIACRRRHGGRELCEACRTLDAYVRDRLERCPYGAAKPTCANCPIHCYRRDMRAAIRDVMAFAGPRMLARHPILALCHVIDGRRPALPPPRRPAAPPPRSAPERSTSA